jgi:hypothetical protein
MESAKKSNVGTIDWIWDIKSVTMEIYWTLMDVQAIVSLFNKDFNAILSLRILVQS